MFMRLKPACCCNTSTPCAVAGFFCCLLTLGTMHMAVAMPHVLQTPSNHALALPLPCNPLPVLLLQPCVFCIRALTEAVAR